MQPPSLLSLTVDSALRHIAHITDLSSIPDQILLELFWKTLRAGKLTEKCGSADCSLSCSLGLSRLRHDAQTKHVDFDYSTEVNAAKLPVLQ